MEQKSAILEKYSLESLSEIAVSSHSLEFRSLSYVIIESLHINNTGELTLDSIGWVCLNELLSQTTDEKPLEVATWVLVVTSSSSPTGLQCCVQNVQISSLVQLLFHRNAIVQQNVLTVFGLIAQSEAFRHNVLFALDRIVQLANTPISPRATINPNAINASQPAPQIPSNPMNDESTRTSIALILASLALSEETATAMVNDIGALRLLETLTDSPKTIMTSLHPGQVSNLPPVGVLEGATSALCTLSTYALFRRKILSQTRCVQNLIQLLHLFTGGDPQSQRESVNLLNYTIANLQEQYASILPRALYCLSNFCDSFKTVHFLTEQGLVSTLSHLPLQDEATCYGITMLIHSLIENGFNCLTSSDQSSFVQILKTILQFTRETYVIQEAAQSLDVIHVYAELSEPRGDDVSSEIATPKSRSRQGSVVSESESTSAASRKPSLPSKPPPARKKSVASKEEANTTTTTTTSKSTTSNSSTSTSTSSSTTSNKSVGGASSKGKKAKGKATSSQESSTTTHTHDPANLVVSPSLSDETKNILKKVNHSKKRKTLEFIASSSQANLLAPQQQNNPTSPNSSANKMPGVGLGAKQSPPSPTRKIPPSSSAASMSILEQLLRIITDDFSEQFSPSELKELKQLSKEDVHVQVRHANLPSSSAFVSLFRFLIHLTQLAAKEKLQEKPTERPTSPTPKGGASKEKISNIQQPTPQPSSYNSPLSVLLQLLCHYSANGSQMAQERSMRTTSVPSIVYLLSNENNTIVARSVSLISNLSQNNRVVGDAFVKGGALAKLHQTLSSETTDWPVKARCMNALSALSENSTSTQNALLKMGTVELVRGFLFQNGIPENVRPVIVAALGVFCSFNSRVQSFVLQPPTPPSSSSSSSSKSKAEKEQKQLPHPQQLQQQQQQQQQQQDVISMLKHFLRDVPHIELQKQTLVSLLGMTGGNEKLQLQVIDVEFVQLLRSVVIHVRDESLAYAAVWTTCEIAKNKKLRKLLNDQKLPESLISLGGTVSNSVLTNAINETLVQLKR